MIQENQKQHPKTGIRIEIVTQAELNAQSMAYQPIPETDKVDVNGKHCYWNKSIDPKYEIGDVALTIYNERGTIIDRGRNGLGNIYRLRVNDPIQNFAPGPVQYNIQEFALHQD